jgi:hypothetical protein
MSLSRVATALAGMGLGWADLSFQQKEKLLGLLSKLEQRACDARQQDDEHLRAYEAWLAEAVSGLAAAIPHMQEHERTRLLEAADGFQDARFGITAIGGFGRVWAHLSRDPHECVRRQDWLIAALPVPGNAAGGHTGTAVRGLLSGLGEMEDHHRDALVTHILSLPVPALAQSLKEMGSHFNDLSDGEQRSVLAAVDRMDNGHARRAVLVGQNDFNKGLVGGLIHVDADLRNPVLDRMMRVSDFVSRWLVAGSFARVESSLSEAQRQFLVETKSAMSPVAQARLLSRMIGCVSSAQ